MILSEHVTKDGYSTQFPLHEQGSGTVRYDVHVRIEPESDTVAALMVYNRGGHVWQPHVDLRCMPMGEVQRVASEVWKRFHKYVPSEVLA